VPERLALEHAGNQGLPAWLVGGSGLKKFRATTFGFFPYSFRALVLPSSALFLIQYHENKMWLNHRRMPRIFNNLLTIVC
jgi:hypothetical protein